MKTNNSDTISMLTTLLTLIVFIVALAGCSSTTSKAPISDSGEKILPRTAEKFKQLHTEISTDTEDENNETNEELIIEQPKEEVEIEETDNNTEEIENNNETDKNSTEENVEDTEDVGFTAQELLDMAYVDAEIQKLIESESFQEADLDTRAELSIALLENLKEEGYITDYYSEPGDTVISFMYSCDVLGGIMIKPWDPMMN